MTVNTEILLDALKLNLHPAGDALFVNTIVSAFGHADLARLVSDNMLRLQTTRALQAKEDEGLDIFANVGTKGTYTDEIEERSVAFWSSVAEVRTALALSE